MKPLRWKYVAPRLAIVLIVAVAVRFGFDPLLRWAIVAGGEAALGAKVELVEVETSLGDGQLVLRGLTVANPNAPMRNLLEASESELVVDIDALCHGRCVVRGGEIRGVRFDTDRETSGALGDESAAKPQALSSLDPWFESVEQVGATWIDQLTERLSGNFVDQLQSPRLVNELEQRWPEQLAQLREEVEALRQQAKQLQQTVRELSDNPLRHATRLHELGTELSAAQRDFQALQTKIAALPQQAEADRQAVLAARAHDEKFLRDQLQLANVEPDMLTQLLLGEPAANGLAAATDWVRWARQRLPSRETAPPVTRSRGTTVVFSPAAPRYFIEQLRIDGVARLGGEPIQLTGLLRAASSEPWLVAEPTTLSLRSVGAAEMTLEVVVDRRAGVATDRLQLSCPQLAMRGQSLGIANQFVVELAPGVARLEIDLRLSGEQLDGEISFRQQSVKLTPRLGAIDSAELSAAIANSLAHVDTLSAQVVLAGTLEKPQMKIQSDLGAQIAAGIESATRELLASRAGAMWQQMDERLQSLGKARDGAQQELLAQLGEGQQLVSSLGRGAVPRLSRSLSLPQLRK